MALILKQLKERQQAVPHKTAASVIRQLEQQLRAHGLSLALAQAEFAAPSTSPSLNQNDLSAELLQTLLLPGATVEFMTQPGAGAHSLALRLLSAALARREHQGWLCVLSPRFPSEQASSPPERMFCASALAQLGIPLRQLMILRPPLKDLPRFAVRAAASGAFVGMIIDATAEQNLRRWPVALRRLSLAAENVQGTFFFLTSKEVHRPLSLPVAVRAEFRKRPICSSSSSCDLSHFRQVQSPSYTLPPLLLSHPDEGEVHIERHRFGHLSDLPVPTPRFHAKTRLMNHQSAPPQNSLPASLQRRQRGHLPPKSRQRQFR
ncbi:MAG: hypothetical protein GY822_22250 [Deltaproteobacteria bacterium]|nr:hypothetical protein [Deltaproteobacteria bacterium]